MVCAWTVAGPVDGIAVRVSGTVETFDTAGVLRGHRETAPPMAWLLETPATVPDDALRAIALRAASADNPLSVAHAMAAAVGEAIDWVPGATDTATTAAQALAAGQGVCQDHAHVLIAVARAAAMPARYVAGYLFDGKAASEAAHAWAELGVEGLGWVGFDPSNRCCPDARYIRLGAGLDARDAAPIRGIARGGLTAERLEVAVSVAATAAAAQGQSQQ
jgi:transglutaminase-like putative cysteine protease